MTLSNKESLAARRYVAICNVIQLLSFVFSAIALELTGHIWHLSSTCCDQQIWWSRLCSCSRPGAPLWLYFALRICLFLHRAWLSQKLSPWFHSWQKQGRLHDSHKQFDDLPATVTPLYLVELPFLIINFVSMIFILHRQKATQPSKWSEWGQSAQLITCFFGICHWIYVSNPIKHLEREAIRYNLVKLQTAAVSITQCAHWVNRQARRRSNKLEPSDLTVDPRSETKSREDLQEDLQWAAELGDRQGMQNALDEGADINDTGTNPFKMETALMRATEQGNVEGTRLLLELGAKPFFRASGRQIICSALHLAAQLGHTEIIMLLRRFGVNINIVDDSGYPPLVLAIKGSREGAVAGLLCKEASIPKWPGDETFITAPVPFTWLGDDAFSKGAANPAWCGDVILEDEDHCPLRNHTWNDPLLMAAAKGNVSIVAQLCAYGANINTVDRNRSSALRYAVKPKSMACVQYLLARGAPTRTLEKIKKHPASRSCLD